METKTMVTIAGLAGTSAPRRNAPTLVLIKGSGVPAAGAVWRGLPRRNHFYELDSAPWASTLV